MLAVDTLIPAHVSGTVAELDPVFQNRFAGVLPPVGLFI